jgi:hypothetical protein
VFIINLATLNYHDSKDAILALEDGIQTAQPWGIGGRIIYFHKASPKEIHVDLTVLLYNHTFLCKLVLMEVKYSTTSSGW